MEEKSCRHLGNIEIFFFETYQGGTTVVINYSKKKNYRKFREVVIYRLKDVRRSSLTSFPKLFKIQIFNSKFFIHKIQDVPLKIKKKLITNSKNPYKLNVIRN